MIRGPFKDIFYVLTVTYGVKNASIFAATRPFGRTWCDVCFDDVGSVVSECGVRVWWWVVGAVPGSVVGYFNLYSCRVSDVLYTREMVCVDGFCNWPEAAAVGELTYGGIFRDCIPYKFPLQDLW